MPAVASFPVYTPRNHLGVVMLNAGSVSAFNLPSRTLTTKPTGTKQGTCPSHLSAAKDQEDAQTFFTFTSCSCSESPAAIAHQPRTMTPRQTHPKWAVLHMTAVATFAFITPGYNWSVTLDRSKCPGGTGQLTNTPELILAPNHLGLDLSSPLWKNIRPSFVEHVKTEKGVRPFVLYSWAITTTTHVTPAYHWTIVFQCSKGIGRGTYTANIHQQMLHCWTITT